MLLHELTGVKHMHHMSWTDIQNQFAAKGIKFVGGGKYGQVFTHPSWDYVIKIFENDPEYMGFVNWVIAHPNKHFPKFVKKPLRMHKFHNRSKNEPPLWYIVKIEKLYPITDKPLMEFLVYELERCAETAWKKHNGYEYIRDNPHYTQRFPDGSMVKGATWEDVFEKFPWTEELGLAYAGMWDAELGHPDIHSGNIMQRKDGTIVIIDPVWEGETPMQAYYAFLRSESGDMYSEYDVPSVSGPSYPHKKKESDRAKQAQQQAYPDEDIPF